MAATAISAAWRPVVATTATVERRSVADNAARLQRRAAGNTALGRRYSTRSTRRGTGTTVVIALPERNGGGVTEARTQRQRQIDVLRCRDDGRHRAAGAEGR